MKVKYSDRLIKIPAENQGFSKKTPIKQSLSEIIQKQISQICYSKYQTAAFSQSSIFNTDFGYSDGNKVRNLQLPVPATLQVSDNTFDRCISSTISMLLRTGLALRQGNTEVLRNLHKNPHSTVCFLHNSDVYAF